MSSSADVGSSAIRRVKRRLIPFLFVLYIVSYLDRINVGFAALQMNAALGLGPAVYGLGAGVFFVSYFLFEVPSNLVLERVGARLWIARIMLSWGLVSTAMMFVSGPLSFYSLRFLLGAAEAGFFPGVILYLTYWFPARERARAVAQFMTATAIAGVVGGPLSGWLLGLRGLGLAGWQWMFLVEGVPAVALAFVVRTHLTDRPELASWLPADERAWLVDVLRREQEGRRSVHRHVTLGAALRSGIVWRLAALYFCIVVGLYGVSFWLPQIVKSLGSLSDLEVGVVSAIPYLAAAVGMVMVGASSDRSGERRWHVAVPAFVSSVGFASSAGVGEPLPALAALSLAAVGIWGALGPFWTLPTAFLSGTAAAGGIALINSVGNLGGFVGPSLLGWIRAVTGHFDGGLLALAVALLCAGLLALGAPSDPVPVDASSVPPPRRG